MKPKILVVEDNISHIENLYKRRLSGLDVDLDFAQSKLEAIEKVRCKTYNVAFVDIMLREDRRDRGGLEVIEYLHKLNEGTAVIVVSATDDIKVSLKAYKAGIVDFIQKENIHTKKDLLDPLEKILDNYKFYKSNPFGRFSTLSAYLAPPEFAPSWDHTIQITLNVGFQIMVDTFNNALEKFLPILRKKDTMFSLITDSQNQCVHGIFWSKGVGCPIWFSAANKEGTLIGPPEQSRGDILKDYKKGDLIFSIWKMINVKRDDFNESIWDELK